MAENVRYFVIERRKQLFFFNKIRTIRLMEADYQLNNKLFGRLIMTSNYKHKEQYTLNAPEQYGAKNHHRIQDVSLNKHLINGLL
jgi:hypothetical protein